MSSIAKIGIGLGLLWYSVLRGVRGLVVRIKSFSFVGVNLAAGTVRLNLDLLIKNPLLVGITIKKIEGDVYAQGHQVGTVCSTYDYYLAGGKTHILPIAVDLNMSDVGQAALLNIQSGDIRSLTIAFDGRIYAGKYDVSVPLQFELDYDRLTQ